MDDALLRPGRLEVQIEIGLPKVKNSYFFALIFCLKIFSKAICIFCYFFTSMKIIIKGLRFIITILQKHTWNFPIKKILCADDPTKHDDL